MKAFIAALATMAICVAASVHASPPAVSAEPMNLEEDTLATIGLQKSKKSTIADGIKASQSKGGGDSSQCGQVNINNNDKKSNSGIKEMFGKQSTTIVTGPVINMANCK